MCDPIADLLTSIRNAGGAKKRFVDVPHSGIKESIVKTLKEKGYVAHFLVKEENKKGTIRVFLKYDQQRNPVIMGLKRVSKPSLRRYVSSQKIPFVLGGIGLAILSTSQGVMDGKSAKLKGIGGELLALVW